jgi:uridine phosphorylase
MIQGGYPILEFDEDRVAFIDPHGLTSAERLPQRGVACFFQDVIERVCGNGNVKEIDRLRTEHEIQPIYELDLDGERLAVFNPGVGGPLAAARLDALAARGLQKVIACGSAGALIPDLAVGQVVVPSAAIRDEGTSYHYLPPERSIDFDPGITRFIEDLLNEWHVPYVVGKTWTTDAIFRETRSRVARRKAEGCITVEMEAASLLAVAKFRKFELGYLLHAGDSLAGDEWDHRAWPLYPGREELFWLAATAATRL